MVHILVRILDQHGMVQTLVRPQEVVSLVLYHLVPAPHAPCAPVPRPSLSSREEVGDHVLQSSGRYYRVNLLHACGTLWLIQFRIEISNHQ